MDIDHITKIYLKIREARAKHNSEAKKKDAELKEQLDRVGAQLLKWLHENKLKNAKTAHGTIHIVTETLPSAADWDVIYKWIVENDAFDMLEKRIKQKFITEYMENHDGALPPGVNVHREMVVRVRQS